MLLATCGARTHPTGLSPLERRGRGRRFATGRRPALFGVGIRRRHTPARSTKHASGVLCPIERPPQRKWTIMTSIPRLLETALYVADLDRSCDFYERVLGLGPDIGAKPESEQRFRPLQMPGGQVLLLFPKGFATTVAVLPGGTIPPH